MTGRRAVVVAAVVAAVGAGAIAAAHTGSGTGYASFAVEGSRIRYSLTLWPAALPAVVADHVARARGGDASSREHLLRIVRDKVTLLAQARRCHAGPAAVQAAGSPADSVTLVVDFLCPEPVRDLVIRDDLFDVLGAGYHTLARIETPRRTVQFAFTAETRETRLHDLGAGVASFVRLGVEHILTGYDHLLFLLALLLPGGGVVALAKIVTAFTVAHSVTLSAAVLDVLVPPDRLIEAVIALSIAAVAAENLYPRPAVSRRWITSFVFGLVHGFGFSSVLREMGLPSQGLLLSLVGFNVGVELSQVAVIAVALPAMALVRATGWGSPLVRGSSVAILVVGVVLFVERTFL